MYEDTAEIGNPHGMTWIDKKLRESLNSQGTLDAYIIEKPRKGYLSLPFITYIQHAHSRTVVRVSRRIKIMHV